MFGRPAVGEELAKTKPSVGARLATAAGRLAKVVGIAVLLLLALGAALTFAPREPLRRWCVAQLQERLGREARLDALALDPWNGLQLRGLAISEPPGFNAGTFFEADRVAARVRWLPLLAGRLSVDELALTKPRLTLARAGERFNASDLLAAGAAAPALDASKLLAGGWNDPRRKLSDLAAVAAGVVSGAAGRLALSIDRVRVQAGELRYEDSSADAHVAATGLTLWADGVALRRARADVGGDGQLSGTLQGQAVAADLEVEAKLESDDAGRLRATSGHVLLGKLRHPMFHTDRVRLDWDLQGLSPEPMLGSGVVRLDGSSGELVSPASIASQGGWARLLLYPVDALAKFRGLALKDLSVLPYTDLRGDYSLQGGSINVAPFYIHGPLVSIEAEGVVNLQQQTVGFKANVAMGKTTIGASIQGPFASPTVDTSVSLSGPKERHRTIHQTLVKKRRERAPDANRLLDEAFKDPDALLKAKATRTSSRRQTLKDAESLIDGPMPDSSQ